MDQTTIATYKAEVTTELENLLNWWMTFTVDHENGGFYGKVDPNNIVAPNAPKGLVLNARILYTFSSAYLLTGNDDYLRMADSAFSYLHTYFLDPEYGGFYWAVDFKGAMLDGKKQVYGQAFAIYAFAEYYKATQNEKALTLAKDGFWLLEKYSFDHIHLGYLEAFKKDWQAIDDLRLSDKDLNEKKSMNTHLHVIEAYTNLYAIWKNEVLAIAIKRLLANFATHIIHKDTHHLQLFFSENWEVKSSLVSFGHDIEAAWLLQEAAEIIADPEEITKFKNLALQISRASTSGLAQNGGLWYEYDPATAHWTKEWHWWPQAEAMVGFFNAWQLSGEEQFLNHSLESWAFIKQYIRDSEKGEWHWGINENYSLMQGEDKAGFWKCPYHNGRACIALIKRTNVKA
ncbi:AGE family epimerase/isomerase [Pedobacter sp. UC225_65]|uniref:AGE family epimerase/isomerase n=1 Tax=Pedobacter sp. UC225_65 TaxID=3350173 RepID=UPI003671F57C